MKQVVGWDEERPWQTEDAIEAGFGETRVIPRTLECRHGKKGHGAGTPVKVLTRGSTGGLLSRESPSSKNSESEP